MYLFRFEPGDGFSYRILFGRLPSGSALIPFYTLFGFAQGDDALISYPFDTLSVSFDTFARHMQTACPTASWGASDILLYTAWRVYAALVGRDEEDAEDHLPDWRSDWRRLLPAAALG